MPIESPKQAFANFIVEQMQDFGPVKARAMFGGFGISRDGLTFALIINEQLYLKADDATKGEFIERGLPPFSYEVKGGTRHSLSYFTAPAEVFDSPDAMAEWARKAYACAVRNNKPKPKTAPAKKTKASTTPSSPQAKRKPRS